MYGLPNCRRGGGQRVYTEGVVIQMKMGLGCYAGDKLDMG